MAEVGESIWDKAGLDSYSFKKAHVIAYVPIGCSAYEHTRRASIMLRAFGCSSTYGTSCKNPATDSWPVLLSNMLQTDCKNYGLSGASNDYIFKIISEKNKKILHKDDIIVVMMTQPNRRYFREKNIMPNISGEVARVYYKYINDDQGDYINFLQNLNAYPIY